MVLAASVLAENEAAAWAHADVVRHVEHLRAGRLVQEREPLLRRVVLPDLASLGVAAVGRDNIDPPVAVPRALKARELGASFPQPLRPDAAVRDRIGIGIVDRHPPHGIPRTGRLALPGVSSGAVREREHLESAPVHQVSRRTWREAVEACFGPILGLVDDARCRVDRNCLVHEPTHGAIGLGRGGAVRRDFEHVSVGHAEVFLSAGTEHGFLA